MPGRKMALPLLLMLLTPLTSLALAAHFNNGPKDQAVLGGLPAAGYGRAAVALAVFAVWQLALLLLLPGKTYYGPPTRSGFRPRYCANGPLAYACSVVAFFALSDAAPGVSLGLFQASIAYQIYPQAIVLLCGFAFVLCFALLLKAHVAPSEGETDVSQGLVSQYFWGCELYPRIAGIDVKQFVNCRFGMMVWGLAPLSLLFTGAGGTFAGSKTALLASSCLQVVYVFKFYLWEAGYACSMDIQHDKAGFYLIWGCLVWVPSFYLSASMALVDGPPGGLFPAVAVVVGLACIFFNYQADAQRQLVRATEGRCMIWGKPAQTIKAPYATENAEEKTSLLLTSGWWGIATHFHYVFEVCAALCWCVPAGLSSPLLCWAYPAFLTALLVDRAVRDDARCFSKYKQSWVEYRRAVPYKIVPGIF